MRAAGGLGSLPTLACFAQALGQAPSPLQPGSHRPCIVVVDDMAMYTDTISSVLHDEGYDCVVLNDGDRMLETVRAVRPDLVLLDVELPGASGYRLCWAIKSDPEIQDTPVALVSAKVEDADHRLGLAMRADTYIDKPFEIADLMAMVRLLLARPGEPAARD